MKKINIWNRKSLRFRSIAMLLVVTLVTTSLTACSKEESVIKKETVLKERLQEFDTSEPTYETSIAEKAAEDIQNTFAEVEGAVQSKDKGKITEAALHMQESLSSYQKTMETYQEENHKVLDKVDSEQLWERQEAYENLSEGRVQEAQVLVEELVHVLCA